MEKLNVVVLSEDIDLRVHLKNLLTSDEIAICGYSECSEAGKLKIQGLFPDAVLCAVKGPVPKSVFDFVQDLLSNIHNCVVILANDAIDVELVNSAAVVGIKKVVPIDLPPEDLRNTIHEVYTLEVQRTLDSNASRKVRSKVIGFFGGKGGTGKTTLAVNVAAAIARSGRKCILVDLDLQFGDVTLVLDIASKDTIVDLVQDRFGISIENVNSFAAVHSTGLNVISAPKSPEFAEYIHPEHIEKLVDTLRPYFEYIIIDFPPAFTDCSIIAAENCDEILLIYNMEIMSLRNAKSTISVLDQLHQKEKIRIVINKNTKGLIKEKDFAKMFDMPIYATVISDTKSAISSVNKGQPIIVAEPRAQITHEIMELAKKLTAENEDIKPIYDVQKKKGLFGGLSFGGKSKANNEAKPKEKNVKTNKKSK